MSEIVYKIIFVLSCGFLYRWGGGGFSFLPAPFNEGFKPARRYALPFMIALNTGWYLPMMVFSAIAHFNLKEIENRRWDDVCTYGFAQAWCFSGAGYASGILGAWWFCGTWLSNIGIKTEIFCPTRLGAPMHWTNCKIDWRLDWFWVELIQGLLIGTMSLIIRY